MSVRNNIIDINFEDIYESRKDDFETLTDHKINRKVLLMHIGGIVIECFVKYLIMYKYDITKRKLDKNNYWYDEDRFNKLINIESTSGKQVDKKDYSKYALILYRNSHEGHDFCYLIKEHLKFDRNNIQDALDTVYNPLGKDKECFIDLRYYDEYSDEITEYIYNNWNISYNKVIKWLYKQSDTITKEYYKNGGE
ncbi:hypothetical protein CLTEP_25320 [Clostridium tepidiprofundi DSM 19306]|uniref:Uncharacterized protein n=1 Tax=Clostridium tepidiprofundi DSM 19306 TaxID=1121338 RepID=A0A151ASP8_9CLOT|nr:hypothetical protein [Clostridium tepidiprofundi]KYH30635.1 hypothetical protein CLTEP_25320 [Clostridium tepidiprofundi DSM 19306]